jgi:hypothetical protein
MRTFVSSLVNHIRRKTMGQCLDDLHIPATRINSLQTIYHSLPGVSDGPAALILHFCALLISGYPRHCPFPHGLLQRWGYRDVLAFGDGDIPVSPHPGNAFTLKDTLKE